MNEIFEREVTLQKDVYEIDRLNEDLAFQLFSKQLLLSKSRNKGQDCS